MKIILDSNIILQDILLKSGEFEMLLDFLSKTAHEVFLPSVVIQEVRANYERRLTKCINTIDSTYTELNNILTYRVRNNRKTINVKLRVNGYINYLLHKLHVGDEKVIESDYISVDDLVSRAVLRTKPFRENKEAFRDSVIWLNVLKMAQSSRERKVVFISNNRKDFGEKSGQLAHELAEEAKRLNVKVDFYLTLDEFLKTRATEVSFVTIDWLEKSIDFEEVKIAISDEFDADKTETYSVLKDMGYKVESIDSFTTYDANIQDYYVYEMADGTLRLEVTFYHEVNFDFVDMEDGEFSITLEGESRFHFLLEGESIVGVEVKGAWFY